MNPNIRNEGIDTRFGGKGSNPQSHSLPSSNRPWSIRNAIRRAIARAASDGRLNVDLIADKVIELALMGNMRAIEYITEQVDGKLPQPTLNADFELIQGMTDEELDEFINQSDAKFVNPKNCGERD